MLGVEASYTSVREHGSEAQKMALACKLRSQAGISERRLQLIRQAARLDPLGADVGESTIERFLESKSALDQVIKSGKRPIHLDILLRSYNTAIDLIEDFTGKELPDGLKDFDDSCFERFINGTKQSVGLRRDIFLELAKFYHHKEKPACEAYCLFVAICCDRNNLTVWKAYLDTGIEYDFPERVNKERILELLWAIGADTSPHRSYL